MSCDEGPRTRGGANAPPTSSSAAGDLGARTDPTSSCQPDTAGPYRSYWIVLITLAGAPAAIEWGGMSVVTTELAPITERSPIVTPLVTTTPTPHQTLSPIWVGR